MRSSVSFVFLILFLLVTISHLQYAAAMAGSGFCVSKCNDRCAKAGVQDRCIKYCGICCEECKCVPSGTYGNKDQCPCYRDKLNKKKQPKCP